MHKGRYQRNQKPSLALQMLNLKRAFPESKCSVLRNRLKWQGMLQPTGVSARYNMELICSLNGRPDVWVSGENISDVDNIPHKYGSDKEGRRVNICLYLPKEYSTEWFFAETIIPWTIEWLYFYEVWLATEIWFGGGEHPTEKDKKKQK